MTDELNTYKYVAADYASHETVKHSKNE